MSGTQGKKYEVSKRRGRRLVLSGALALSVLVAPAPTASATEGSKATNGAISGPSGTAVPTVPGGPAAPQGEGDVLGMVIKYAPDVVEPLSDDAPVPGAAAAGVDLRPGAPVGLGWFEVDLPEPVNTATADQIAAHLSADPAVEYAEPQLWMRPSSTPTPNDPRWLQQWGFSSYGDVDFVLPGSVESNLDRQVTGSNLLEALTAPRGDTPTVAVIDNGVVNHPDLTGRLTTGYNFISDPARAGGTVADEAFGRGPDFYDPGDWTTAQQASSVPFSQIACSAPQKSTWHGTHVSGTIAALTNNDLGGAGTVPAELQTLRALGRCGGTSGDIAAAMLWASGGSVPGVPANPNPARVVNMSLGGSGQCPQHVQDVIDYGTANGTVFVVAAGNENSDAANVSPANCAGVITVAATDPYGGRASFSNYGATVDLAAPGTGIMSTLDSGLEGPLLPTYGAYSGTSAATPHVAGAVALLLAAEPNLTPTQVRDRVKASATPFKQIANFGGAGAPPNNPAYDCVDDDPCGAGYLNTAELLGQPTADAPVIAPRFQVREAVSATDTTDSTLVLNDRSVDVRFKFEPSRSNPDNYFYNVSRNGAPLSEGFTTETDVTVTVPGTIDDAYEVFITPRTGIQLGVAAQAMEVPNLDGGIPPVPSIKSVSTNDTTAMISVTNTYSVPAIQTTTVTAQPGGLTCELFTKATASSCMIPNLETGTEYTFTATSRNAFGTSEPSAPQLATPQVDSPPTAPVIESVVMQGTTATVSWSPSIPAEGRSIAGYNVVVIGADPTQFAMCSLAGNRTRPPVTFCQVPNLYVGGRYQFVAVARDDLGHQSRSVPSAEQTATGTAVAPSAPTAPPDVQLGDGKATVGPFKVELSAGDSLFNGGSPILGVTYTATPGGASCSVPWGVAQISTCEITGLTNGQPYTFTAATYSVMGASRPSEATVPLTPGEQVVAGELTVLPEPLRVLDTRLDSGPVAPGTPITVDVGAPEDAIAVAYNLTITGTTGSGYATLYPAGEQIPGTSVSNWIVPGQTVANGYVTGLGEAGAVQIALAGTPAQAVLDIVGFYTTPAPTDSMEEQETSGLFLPMPPQRAYDSRIEGGALRGGESRTVDLSGMLPGGATAVAYTLTETGTTGTGFLAVGLPGSQTPTTSVINWSGPNQTVANSSTAAVNSEGQFEVFAGGGGSTQFVVDILGYFAPREVSPDGLRFTPITPARAYDSRVDTPGGQLVGGQDRTTSVAPIVPPNSSAVAANLTATGTTGSGWLALTPGGTEGPPGISTLNWMRPNSTLANGTVTGTLDDVVTTFAAGGSTQYVLDVAGYYHRPR